MTTQLLHQEKAKDKSLGWKVKLPGDKMVAKVFLSGHEKTHLE